MASHPHLGIPQSKPRLPKAPGNGAPASKEALAKLSAEYLVVRNRQMTAKAAAADMKLARRRGELIARYDVKVQLGFLLTGLRQRLMSFSHSLPRRLAGKNEHEIGRLLDAEVRSALKDISSWPEKMAAPGWCRTKCEQTIFSRSNYQFWFATR